jgi:hypothetical protein
MSEIISENDPVRPGPSKRASAAKRRLQGAVAVLGLGAALVPFLASGASASTSPDAQLATALAQEGYTATEVATVLLNEFQDGIFQVTALLNDNGYNGVQIAQALQTAYGANDVTVVNALNNIGYSYGGVAATVQYVFGDSAAQVIDAYGSLNLASGAIVSQVTGHFGDEPYTMSTSDPWNLYIPLLMGVSGASTSAGASVVQWGFDSSPDQFWYVLPTDSGYAEIVDENSGMCLSVAGNSPTPGTDLIQWPCGEANYSQQWYLGPNGTYPNWSENNWNVGIQSRLNPGLYAEVQGQSRSDGAAIDQWSWNGGWNQVWHFTTG